MIWKIDYAAARGYSPYNKYLCIVEILLIDIYKSQKRDFVETLDNVYKVCKHKHTG